MSRLLPLSLPLLLGACATYTALAPEERALVERELQRGGAARFLRVSFYATPFFGDDSKRLLTAVPPDEVRLLLHPDGTPVDPAARLPQEARERLPIFPAGTRARILAVEFPTTWTVTSRVAYTPRNMPWVYVAIDGQPAEPPFVLVLPPDLDSPDRFFNDLDRYLSEADPERLMAPWGDSVRAAIRAKQPVIDMPAEAAEMALGYPELKRIHFEGPLKREEWFYAGKRRVAIIGDGRLLRVENRSEGAAP